MSNTAEKDQIHPMPRGGNYDLHVDMYYLGQFIGTALVKGAWSARTARIAALRGIATSIYPMSDKDQIVYMTEKPK